MNLRFTIITLIATAMLIISVIPSCGAGNKPVERDPRHYEVPGVPIYTYRYYPYVERIEFGSELVPEDAVTVVITVVLPDDIPESLYYLDTLSDPITLWEEGVAYLSTALGEWEDEDAAEMVGVREYDGSGQLIHHLLVPSPGEYELRYWSAASPELAGKYAIEREQYTGNLELRCLYLEVPETE